ncbi:LysE family translocator [Motilimonas sp. 1_MG-2023]|uniref:LysE family translocator n=1 Tax=Motilimonas TaxID=1914248 RepID=UPI0026E2BC0F|nr:LysE family transporter [Motilimonas sp. 1_MG-2023]MDO6525053.1 LysE family transporter [Motilimonas sp. 1_MG-2023]
MISAIVAMSLFALVGAISPGPVNIIATSIGAQHGFKQALPHITGATLAYTLIVWLVGLGVQVYLVRWPFVLEGMGYLGGLFLLYLAYQIAVATPVDTTAHHEPASIPTMMTGAMAQLLNPKAWLVSISGVSLFISGQADKALLLGYFVVISLLMCSVGISSWALLGQGLQKLLADPMRQRYFNWLMSALLVLSVLTIWSSTHTLA